MRPFGTDISQSQDGFRIKLILDLQVPFLHVGSSVVRQPASQADILWEL